MLERETVHAQELDAVLTGDRTDLQRIDVPPDAITGWTNLIEDLHLRSMAGETSAGGVQWVHRQVPIVWDDGKISIIPYHDWDQVPVDRQGALEWLLIMSETATIVVASIRGSVQPNDVEIRLYGSSPDTALGRCRHVELAHSDGKGTHLERSGRMDG